MAEFMDQVWDAYWQNKPTGTVEALNRVVALVREHCAKIAEDYDGDGMEGGMDFHLGDAFQARREIAERIRSVGASA